MKKSVKVKFLCVLLVSLFAFATPYQVQALGIPVLDTSSFVQAIKQTISAIKESKVVVGIITTVKKTSAAIGTAKATVSEYVIKNKEKIEAKVEKVKKYKERAEEYKKEYEAYKAMLDENIAKAKEMKEMAEQKYNQAQDTVNKVKDTVGTVKDTANAAIDMAKNKADDIKGKVNDVTDKVGGAVSTVRDSIPNNQRTSNNGQSAEEIAAKKKQILAEQANVVSSTRKAFSSSAKELAATQAAADKVGGQAAGGLGSAADALNAAKQSFQEEKQRQKEAIISTLDKEAAAQQAKADKQNAASGSEDQPAALNMEQIQQQIEAVSDKVGAKDKVNNAKSKLDAIGGSSGTAADKTKKVNQRIQDTAKASAGQVKSKEKNLLKQEKLQQTIERNNAVDKKQPMRRQVFTTSSLRQTESLVFAKAAILPNNGTDVNNTVVIPPALSKACGGISAEDALVKGTVDACLLKLNQERSGAQAYSGYGASKAFNRALAQYVAVGIAEAYKARQEADSFEEQYVDPIDMAIENNVRDIYADIVQMNRAIDMQMNNLLKIYSTQLVTRALYNYDKYMFLPAEKKDE